jgi:hypothetical protein
MLEDLTDRLRGDVPVRAAASGSLSSIVSSVSITSRAAMLPPWPLSTKMRSKPWRAADRTTQPTTAAIVA